MTLKRRHHITEHTPRQMYRALPFLSLLRYNASHPTSKDGGNPCKR